jgi:hypothetical protein
MFIFEGNITTTPFELRYGMYTNLLIINNTIGTNLLHSSDGINYGTITYDLPIEFENLNENKVWLKASAGTIAVIIKAWGDRKILYPTPLGQSNSSQDNPAVPSDLQNYRSSF